MHVTLLKDMKTYCVKFQKTNEYETIRIEGKEWSPNTGLFLRDNFINFFCINVIKTDERHRQTWQAAH